MFFALISDSKLVAKTVPVPLSLSCVCVSSEGKFVFITAAKTMRSPLTFFKELFSALTCPQTPEQLPENS